jgi:TRAP-type mannitol/chloroaromatic compound transport system substrate-binding protein
MFGAHQQVDLVKSGTVKMGVVLMVYYGGASEIVTLRLFARS